MVRLTALLVFAFLALGCARSISPEAKEQIAKPVNCDTARQDIAALDAEKASVAKQVSSGVRSVAPPAAIAGILRGDTKDRARVATGAYNRELEAKVNEIKRECGL